MCFWRKEKLIIAIILALCFIAPIVIFRLVDDQYLGRFLALSSFFLGIFVLIFIGVVYPDLFLLNSNKQKRRIVKTLSVFGIFIFIYFSWEGITGSYLYFSGKSDLKTTEGIITKFKSNIRDGGLSERFTLNNGEEYFFMFPSGIQLNHLYQIKTLPNTNIVLGLKDMDD